MTVHHNYPYLRINPTNVPFLDSSCCRNVFVLPRRCMQNVSIHFISFKNRRASLMFCDKAACVSCGQEVPRSTPQPTLRMLLRSYRSRNASSWGLSLYCLAVGIEIEDGWKDGKVSDALLADASVQSCEIAEVEVETGELGTVRQTSCESSFQVLEIRSVGRITKSHP